MARPRIDSYADLSRLLLAGRLCAADRDPAVPGQALARLLADPRALSRAIRGVGLAPLAAEMAKRAAQIDGHVTHEGWAKDDARRVFWQALPLALADPAPLAATPLDPGTAAEALTTTVRQGPLGRDFEQAAFAGDYFRALLAGALTVMSVELAAVDGVGHTLWRLTLARYGFATAPE